MNNTTPLVLLEARLREVEPENVQLLALAQLAIDFSEGVTRMIDELEGQLSSTERRVLGAHSLSESEERKLTEAISNLSSTKQIVESIAGGVRNQLGILRVANRVGLDVSEEMSNGLRINKQLKTYNMSLNGVRP